METKLWVCTECETRFGTCAEISAHFIDGDTCPNQLASKKFEEIMTLEFDLKSAKAGLAFVGNGLPDYLWQARHNRIKNLESALHSAIDGLTPTEMANYGDYRIAYLRAE